MDLHTCVFECNWFNYWSPWPLTPIKCGPSVNLAPLRRTLCGCGGDWGRCVFVRRCKDVSAGDWNCLLSLSVRWLLSLKLFSSVSYYTSCDNTPPHPHTPTHAYAQPYRHGRFHVHVHTQSISWNILWCLHWFGTTKLALSFRPAQLHNFTSCTRSTKIINIVHSTSFLVYIYTFDIWMHMYAWLPYMLLKASRGHRRWYRIRD